jgi:integrase/recombinase XerD
MAMVLEEKWPVLGRHARAAEWLGIWADLGQAPRTIDAYGRGLGEYLQVCEQQAVDPMRATRAQVAVFVRELTMRPGRRGENVVALDSGAGLANVTLQQRLVPVRLFYDYLVEEGLRESNPVGRGSYTPGRSFGGGAGGGRPLVPRMVKPNDCPSTAQRSMPSTRRTASQSSTRSATVSDAPSGRGRPVHAAPVQRDDPEPFRQPVTLQRHELIGALAGPAVQEQ